ncbi:MAG: LacI family transcriptional regulator [Clostridiales bacterium]|nr:LacI family transcriptional regulator [Clostridiales bacterium]
MVTIKDIADMLGLSTTTVSNVIHGKTSEVSQKTVERVQKLLTEYEYVPNISARNLAQNCSGILGVAIKGRKDKYDNIIADPFFAELIGGIEAETRARGYFMMIYTSDDVNEILHRVSIWNVDGLILVGMLHDDFFRIRSKYKKPVILVDSYAPRDVADYVNIGLDDEGGCYDMTKYLLENGHRRIAFLADNMEGVDYYRYLGHRRAMEEFGIHPREEDLLVIRPGMLELESNLKEICLRARDYTAFMCCSDYYAVTLMNYLADQGIRIPEELSFTGFDDNMMAKIVRPALTTVRQDVKKKSRLVVKYLAEMIQGKMPEEKNIILPTERVVRDSVKKIERTRDE